MEQSTDQAKPVTLEELSHALNAIDGEGDISEYAEATEFLQENSIAIARLLKAVLEAK